jgi:hypothetical protein
MSIRFERGAAFAAIAVGALFGACDASSEATRVERAIVYGNDDRREAYEIQDPAARATLEGSVVALVPRALARRAAGGFAADAPSLEAAEDLCPGVPFGHEPAAAFCTGVLVDWDLVLTAGHCVRLFALEDFVVVRGYYDDSPGHLAVVSADDVRDVAEIVDEALDPAGTAPRLDHAWLRLSRPVRAPWRPAPVRMSPAVVDEPVVSIGAGGGVPLKLDDGGRIRDLREPTLDYFTADTDTAHGSSGGGAFDLAMNLVGVLARGGDDLVATEAGCNVNASSADGAHADEEFTYAFRAVESLCRNAPGASSLCRAECGDVCAAEAPPPEVGCAVTGGRFDERAVALLAALFAWSRLRSRNPSRPIQPIVRRSS